ncbi:L-ascorbate metabolism protein UlaG (beta-lactamase superfamily) [Trichococcus patagoniensis]|uniref:L-ascorbate metabolism protein UlaG (Beta-lactamase superfamily) n=1 Tax=Trichococcus patagoniensis TaxID=382641 RepID=A0A2T5IJ30_9LACT|nr:MBL fold metallo-hydrolase [Trichococcus patagoniensis]PTQ83819.1 L-ascorbate metabolism protein UlaG (beta-lactamase superfamily) [Trichococcus patagoniensis]
MTEKQFQATPPATRSFGPEAFGAAEGTTLRWLGNSGLFINTRGTQIMVDPVLEGFDMPLLIDMPIKPEEVPHLDAMLITHADNDHFSRITLKKVADVCASYHGPHYVAELLEEEGIPAVGHDIHDSFNIGKVKVTVTPADHAWQNERKKYNRIFKFEDFCGFWIETEDGTIWIPGDSRLLPEQLEMPQPDVIFFDFSDNSWHIGFDNAVKLANTYPKAALILQHWGTVDAPTLDVFNGNPEDLMGVVDNPERIHVLAAGEAFTLNKTIES